MVNRRCNVMQCNVMTLGLLIIGVPARSAIVTLSTKWRKSRSTGFSLTGTSQDTLIRTVQKLCWLMYFKRHVSEEFGVSARVNEKFQGLYKSCVGWAFPLSCWAVGHQLGCKMFYERFNNLLQLSTFFQPSQNCLSLIFKSFKIILCWWLSFRSSMEVILSLSKK